MRRAGVLVSFAIAAALGVAVAPGCSLGKGQGEITGTLDIPACWSGAFHLDPDFYAGVPYKDALTIRIQNGSDYQTFSDGISILVDDVHKIRGDNGNASLLGQELKVTLPVDVTPPGVPITPNPDPGVVHLTLYLGQSCRTQNVAVYGVDTVALNPDGSCGATPDSGAGELPLSCPGSATGLIDAGSASEAGAAGDAAAPGSPPGSPGPTAHSTLRFDHLFNNDPDETDAAQRLTQGSFTVYLADPRDVCPGGIGPPPRCRGMLKGDFKFYFERGRPGQPFP